MHAALAYHERDMKEELTLFDSAAGSRGTVLAASPAEASERTGVVGDRAAGASRRWLDAGKIQHLAHHLAFVAEKRNALGLGRLAVGGIAVLQRRFPSPGPPRSPPGGDDYLSVFGAYPFHTHSMACGRNCCWALPTLWPAPRQNRYWYS